MGKINNRIVFFVLCGVFICYSFTIYYSEFSTQKLATRDEMKGRELFINNSCNTCHQIYGLGGYWGPDLTNVIGNKGREYVKAFIRNGTNKMPKFGLSESELEQICSYLDCVDKTGKSLNNKNIVNSYGYVYVVKD